MGELPAKNKTAKLVEKEIQTLWQPYKVGF
jgi:hypothetical protein